MSERVKPKSTMYIQSAQTNDREEHVIIGQDDRNDDYECQELLIGRTDARRIIQFLRQQFNLE